jgi:hypothetical protein
MKNFFANFNVFVACFVLLAVFTAGPFLVVIIMFLSPLASMLKGHEGLTYPLVYGVIASLLILRWWKAGLVPVLRKPELERRYRFGHWSIAITNIVIVTAVAGPLLLIKLTGDSNMGLLAMFAAPLVGISFISWGVGLYMVWSSRA